MTPGSPSEPPPLTTEIDVPITPPVIERVTGSRDNASLGSLAESASPLDLVFRIPGAEVLAERLGRPELRRRLLHMLPGFLPLVLWVYPHEYPWELPLRVWVAALSILLAFFSLKHFQSVARRGETSGMESVLGYSFSVIGALAVAPHRPEFTLMVLTILAFGDGCATLGGVLIGGPRLFWNQSKTWAGLLSFWLCGTVVSTLAYWGEVVPSVSLLSAAAVGAAVTAAAAVAESLPSRINDNLRVGVVTLAACFAVVEQQYIPLRMMAIGALIVWLSIRFRRQSRGDGVDVRG